MEIEATRRRLTDHWTTAGISVGEPRPIDHGMQFEVAEAGAQGIVRLYAGRRGIRLDLSQVRDDALRARLTALADPGLARERTSAPLTPLEDPTPPDGWIGTDEAGKGDYFGPLVVAAVHLPAADLHPWRDRGLADSKTLSRTRILALAEALEAETDHAVVTIGPRRYNDLYRDMGNLNRVLAWAHARALREVQERTACRHILIDRFGNPRLVLDALGAAAAGLAITQRPRGESNPAVAAASILARRAFLQRLAALERRHGVDLPRGAGAPVLTASRRIVQTRGEALLEEVAKLHFKITGQATDRGPTSNGAS